MNHRLCLLILPLLLGACSTGEQKDTPPVMSQRMSDRIAASRKRMADQNDRSVFDKSMQSGITKGKDTGGWLGRKNYKSNRYAATQAYTNTKGYKTSSFAGPDGKSSMAKETYAQSDKAATALDGTYKTSDSRFNDDSSQMNDRAFSAAEALYKTRADREVLRSQNKNNRPHIIEQEEQKSTPVYTEDQVRRLLGR